MSALKSSAPKAAASKAPRAASKAPSAASAASKPAKHNKTYTITYGDVAENHAGMVKHGRLHANGYSFDTLCTLYHRLVDQGITCEMYDLHSQWKGQGDVEPAYILVIRRGAQHILGTEGTVELMAENDALPMDKQAFMKGRVVNKRARWNLCFTDEDIEPDYKKGQGRVVAWKHLPLMQRIRETIADWTEDVLLNGEANYYYDLKECGIGYHGDAERRKVFAVRMGADMPIHYQWFQRSKSVGNNIVIPLSDGDMYAMSEKAVGTDWLLKNKGTLRHATGSIKYTFIKPEVLEEKPSATVEDEDE